MLKAAAWVVGLTLLAVAAEAVAPAVGETARAVFAWGFIFAGELVVARGIWARERSK